MKLLLTTLAAMCTFGTYQLTKNSADTTEVTSSKQEIIQAKKPASSSKIQVAILLDVSNSMDGLIDQAKSQLWNMVNTVGKATCEGETPAIEIALYEYGRSSNNQRDGYIKKVSPFTKDLDQLSEELFKLTTNGGDEYCSHVIYISLQQLNWDTAANTYKVIFIAGNEDFNQGSVTWSTACAEAKRKGVTVNTIYCGDRAQGMREHWNLGSECGNGSYTNINQNAKLEDIRTPYDSMLFVLNDKLNVTYIGYGTMGESKAAKQVMMDKANKSVSANTMAARVSVKGKANLYKNEEWDLVDATAKDPAIIEKVDMKSLPAEYKNKTKEEVKQLIQQKGIERGKLQNQIAALSAQREAYIAAERKKNATKAEATLETEVERVIKQQVRRYNMIIE
ncbi:vWA domain-containing protein [Aridibaculum aurantiacum]|uniref:vWA domain-containing protein n=1 Tax=Aridibaculum aurantiacum TaxID=2810307 RepID=UPI001A95A0B8|nr:vWA domain-containing protein [Aridibaculum aurantiacum]